MKTLLLTTLALTLAFASPNLVSAGGGNKGGGNKNGIGNFNVSKYLGGGGGGGGNNGGNHNRNNNNYNRNQSCNNNNNGGNYLNNGNYLTSVQAYEPFHNSYFVQPGDTFYEVSMKEYGSSAASRYIASYNRLATNSALVPGQRLMLPSVSRSGVMTASRAPAPENLAAPANQYSSPQAAAPATPATETSYAASDANLPSVSVGSGLSLDGVEFGEASGSVRLKVGPVSVPVTVTEWTASSVKVQLPTVDLDAATPASIDVFRADGSIASQSAVKLTPAGTQVVKAE